VFTGEIVAPDAGGSDVPAGRDTAFQAVRAVHERQEPLSTNTRCEATVQSWIGRSVFQTTVHEQTERVAAFVPAIELLLARHTL
jgi:hypothetical protein